MSDRAGKLPELTPFPLARQANLIRAEQKDEVYIQQIAEGCHDTVRRLLGPAKALHWSRETNLVAEFLYYSLTTGTGLQTLGEEYCNILQSRGELGAAPLASQRRVLTLLETLGPYFMEKLAPAEEEDEGAADWRQYRATLQARQAERVSSSGDTRPYRVVHYIGQYRRRVQHAWHTMIGDNEHVMAFRAFLHEHGAALLRVHLALFYVFGAYYQLPKRLTGIRYIAAEKPNGHVTNYRVLGSLLLIQLGVTGAIGLCARWGLLRSSQGREAAKRHHARLVDARTGKTIVEAEGRGDATPGSETDVPPHRRCPLCLSARTAPTAAPCGHMFCWACIAEWAAQKPECPLCRADCQTSQLVCVTATDF